MTKRITMSPAELVLERLRSDLGGNSLGERIGMEVLRLRGEGQDELAEQLAALREGAE